MIAEQNRLSEQQCPHRVNVEFSLCRTGMQTFEQVPQQPNSAPVSWIDADHELFINLDGFNLTHPIRPVIEIRPLLPISAQSLLNKSTQRVAIAGMGQRDSRRPDSDPGRNMVGPTGVTKRTKLL